MSSTQSDLREERDTVAKVILELGHIPVGMEMFSAADENQWQLIQRQIDQSDYYIVILAHRYGSLAGDVSYTEKEYDYAFEKGIPVLGFVIDKNANWPGERFEQDNTKREKLSAFKDKVQSKMVSFWNNADQLNTKLLAALSKQFALTPRPGWIRATDIPGPEVLAELSRLSKENSELRMRVTIEPKPEFEIIWAILVRATPTQFRAEMVVLIHYNGPVVYLPSHRYQLVVDANDISHSLSTEVKSTSPLIHMEGSDLQISGSGFIHLVSLDMIDPAELKDAAKMKFVIRLRSDERTVLSVDLKSPDWRSGDEGINLSGL